MARKLVHCYQCEGDFETNGGIGHNPVKCGLCGSKKWYSETKVEERYQALLKVDQSKPLPLKTGMHCPYETVPKSHTVMINSDLSPIRYYCCSCDATFDLYGNYLGVVVGIGMKR